MSLTAELRQQFEKARRDQPSIFEERPEFAVSLRTLNQVLEPVEELLRTDPVYANHEISVDYKLNYLRQTCRDLQLASSEEDGAARDQKNDLLNVLQAVVDDVVNARDGFARVDYQDLYELSQLSHVIRADAEICNNEMKRELGVVTASDVQTMLLKTADRIDAAQKRAWQPKITQPRIDLDAVASNDAVHDQLNIA